MTHETCSGGRGFSECLLKVAAVEFTAGELLCTRRSVELECKHLLRVDARGEDVLGVQPVFKGRSL